MSIEGRTEERNTLKGSVRAIPLIDKTLTKDGQCADAKAVGDRFQEQDLIFNEAIGKAEANFNSEIARAEEEIRTSMVTMKDDLNNIISEEISRAENSEAEIIETMSKSDLAINERIDRLGNELTGGIRDTNTRLDDLSDVVSGNEELFGGSIADLSEHVDQMEAKLSVVTDKQMIKIIKTDNTTNYDDAKNTFLPITGTVVEEISDDTSLLEYHQSVVDVGDRTGVTAHGVLVGYGVSKVRVTANIRYKNNSSSNSVLHTYINVIRKDGTEIIRQGVASSVIDSYQTQHISNVIEVFDGDFIFLNSYKATAGRDIDVVSDYNGTYLIVEALEVFGDE